MKLLSALLIFLVAENSFLMSASYAEDTAAFLKQGEAAPFAGYLITYEKANKIRIMDIDLKLSNKTNSLLQSQISLLANQNKLADEQINNLSKRLVDERDMSFLSKVGYFLLGGAVASLVAFGAARSVR